ncbi:GAF domain-containing protein [Lysinibacillus sp. FSL K6-0075]|uniref:GAF domain-containing protein n=1 Tax=Lysinibacillus sp. FSL K6-0075 TaxID=2921415 RepID=UPI003158AF59
METVIKSILEVVPGWSITILAIIIIIMVVGIAILIWWTLFKTVKVALKDNTEKSLKEDIRLLTDEKAILESHVARMENIVSHARSFTNSYNKLINGESTSFEAVIQRMIESLSNDIKMTPKNGHRSGFWLYDEEGEDGPCLKLLYGSSAFPDTYFGERRLGINNSVAGRSYRKNKIEQIDDVHNDPDWATENSTSKYQAILCIPISGYGVLTVDSNEAITEHIRIIVELYAVLIEGVFEAFQRYEINETSDPS